MNKNKKHEFIIDDIGIFDCHEGCIKWHLSSFPEISVISYCQSKYSNGPYFAKNNVVIFGDDNSIEIFNIKQIEILNDTGADYLFMPDYKLFVNDRLDQTVGVTGVLNYNKNENEWYFETELFPEPLCIDSENIIDKSFDGKRCKMITNFDLHINQD